MRVTNNMIMKNNIRNINRTKEQVSKLNDQMTSQKKITKASENPVIAIRSLRLRNTQTQITQYLDNNIKDAKTWIDSSEEALTNIKEALGDAYDQFVSGSNTTNNLSDLGTYIDSLQSLVKEVYQEANSDLNGRTLFTGYKTGQTLTFEEDEPATKFRITEVLNGDSISTSHYYSDSKYGVTTSGTTTYNAGVPTDTEISSGNADTPVTYTEEYERTRLRLSYNELESPTIEYSAGSINVTTTTSDAYESAGATTPTDNSVIFLEDTGEIIISDTIKDALKNNNATISVTYGKTGFSQGEIRPQMYFDCTDKTDSSNEIIYTKEDQNIEYTIAQNTTLAVNKEGKSFLSADFYRDIEELVDAYKDAQAASDKVSEIQNLINSSKYANNSDAQAYLKNVLDAAQSELDYKKQNVNNLFSAGITATKGYVEDLANAISDMGNKESQLTLVTTRVTQQETSVKSLISDNENDELSEIVIKYTAAYNAYESALLAASKSSQNTLLDYI